MCDVACIVMAYCNVRGTSDSGVCCADVEDDELWLDHLGGRREDGIRCCGAGVQCLT
jgi:hypothetical protein